MRARRQALLRTAYMLTGNLADAEDLVQSALAKTYLAWDRIEDRGAVDGYVRRAMVNTHISWWRRRRVEEFPTDEIPDQAIADHLPVSHVTCRNPCGALSTGCRSGCARRSCCGTTRT